MSGAQFGGVKLDYPAINALRRGDVIRAVRPESVIPGGDHFETTGPIERIKRFGSPQVLAVVVNGHHFDRASSDFYAVEPESHPPADKETNR